MGSLVTYSYTGAELTRTGFSQLSAQVVTFPALDKSVTGPGQMTFTFNAATVTSQPNGGTTSAPATTPAHTWSPSAFTLYVERMLMSDVVSVTRIDSLQWSPQGFNSMVGLTMPAANAAHYSVSNTRQLGALVLTLNGEDGNPMFKFTCPNTQLMAVSTSKLLLVPTLCQGTYTAEATQ